MKRQISSNRVKAEALRLGFSACGLATAEAVSPQYAAAFRQWIGEGHEAEMGYMKNHEEKRLDPRLLVEGAQTVISVALNYYPENKIPDDQYQIAWYAYGKDYHDVMKAKLNALWDFIKQEYLSAAGEEIAQREDDLTNDPSSPNPTTSVDNTGIITKEQGRTEPHQSAPSFALSKHDSPPPIQGRVFCDTAPVLERYWAQRAGLGWIGKNTQLIIPQAGSCFFLGEIIIDVEADHYDSPQENRCGSCTKCIDACPTQAINAPFRLYSERCISYLTIEYRGELGDASALKWGNKIYGCDECLKSCPWNRFAKPNQTAEFRPAKSILSMKKEDWHLLTEDQYKVLFKGSAVKRAKYSGLTRNIKAVK